MDLCKSDGVHTHPLGLFDLIEATLEGLGLRCTLLDVEVVEKTEFHTRPHTR